MAMRLRNPSAIASDCRKAISGAEPCKNRSPGPVPAYLRGPGTEMGRDRHDARRFWNDLVTVEKHGNSLETRHRNALENPPAAENPDQGKSRRSGEGLRYSEGTVRNSVGPGLSSCRQPSPSSPFGASPAPPNRRIGGIIPLSSLFYVSGPASIFELAQRL